MIGCVTAGIWALARVRPLTLAPFGSPLIATLAYALGYFLCLGVAASSAHVDPVDQRLAAPGFGPALLAAAQGAGLAYSTPGFSRKTQLVIAFAVLGVCLLAATEPLLSTRDLLRTKFVPPLEPIAAYSSGFGASPSRHELSRFYAGELGMSDCVSVTMLNAEAPPGRVRREWFAIAEALAAPALIEAKTEIVEVTRERIAIGMAAHEKSTRLVFVPSRIPELQRIRVPGRAERVTAIGSRVAEVMTRIADQARANGCARHWIIVPRAAEWFRVDSDQRFGAARVANTRIVGGYQAILVEFVE